MFAPIFACLIGCGAQVGVTIEAKAGPDARAETHFVLAASDPNVRPGNPDYILISKAVARALASQGTRSAAPTTTEASVSGSKDRIAGSWPIPAC